MTRIDRLTLFLDKIFKLKPLKNLFIYSLLIFLLWIFKSPINDFICNYLTIPPASITSINLAIYFLIVFVALLYITYRLVLKKYSPSLVLTHFIIGSFIFYSIIRFTNYRDKWYLIRVKDSEFLYLDLIGGMLFAYILSLVSVEIWRAEYRKTANFENNPFSADDPLTSKDDDKLGYGIRAKKIIDLLRVSNFKKSFTIGLVGPWGNGKSSLISIMEKDLKDDPISETLSLKFLPYLNHSETDIISEFFNQLSKEISNHSGRLANHFLNYSDKLLKLYKNKSIKEFLVANIPNPSSRSTSIDTYDKINKVLERLDKRFIVFIDDLDRLSSKEVLQVLKLVRNTANFRNFIFFIALDKDYVLNTLINNNDISDHTFVDKFFQLEVYLPEIDKTQLKNDFIDQLKLSALQSQVSFIDNVSDAIYQTNNLFDDYITNHRGSKRLVNQLVFDYNMLPDELDANDFLNFTYLKMSFPSAIKYLNNNWQEVLPYDPNTKLRELEGISPKEDNKDILKMVRNVHIFSSNSRFNPNLEDYKLTKDSIQKEENMVNIHLSNQQNQLLGKTIIALFGKENKNPQHTSIKFGNNLKKLLQQRLSKSDLTNSSFINVLNAKDDFETLRGIINLGQTQHLLDRITFYSPESFQQIKNITVNLLFLFNQAEIYGTHSIHVLQVLSDFIKNVFVSANNNDDEVMESNKSDLWQEIKLEFLEKDYIAFKKLEFLAFLSENRIRLDFSDWGTEEETLKAISLDIYTQFLEGQDEGLWKINDYTFYHAYHKVRKFHPTTLINPLVIEFWKDNNVKILCAQMTETETWSTKMLKTSDHASTIFGSKEEYRNFIIEQITKTGEVGLNEYLRFLDLEYLSGFSDYIRFEYRNFDEVIEKIKLVKANQKIIRDEFENVVEIFIKSENDIIQAITTTNVTVNKFPTLISNLSYNNDGKFITKIRLTTDNVSNIKLDFLNHYLSMLNERFDEYTIDEENYLLLENGKKVLEFISIQPSDYES